MTTDKWDRRFLELAKHISSYSKDPSTKVGAIIANDEHLVVGIGYNGFPRGVEDSEERLNDRETKYSFVVHAEANAILMAGDKAQGARLYVWPSFESDQFPPVCNECCKLVIQSGIKEIVGWANGSENNRWRDSLKISATMCKEAGVFWRGVPNE